MPIRRNDIYPHLRHASGTHHDTPPFNFRLATSCLFSFQRRVLKFTEVFFQKFMWQLGTISMENKVADHDQLRIELETLKNAGTDGVMVDCWWGIVEGTSPLVYNWSGYRELFTMVRDIELKLQVSFLCNSSLRQPMCHHCFCQHDAKFAGQGCV